MSRRGALPLVLVALFVAGCATIRRPAPQPPPPPSEESGLASWYGQEFAGRATANGEIFDPMALTAAHRTLPFGTILEVTNPKNGRRVRVRINDRGPFIGKRVLDLSYAAALELGMIEEGVIPVQMRIVDTEAAPAPLAVSGNRRPIPMDAPPPPVPFPLPGEEDSAAGEEDFNVKVDEIRGGVEMQRRVAADGRTIEGGPSPTPPPYEAAARNWFVQLGAFQVRENAVSLREKIASVAPNVFIETSGAMHRVRVGPYATREEATEERDHLEDAGFSGVIMSAP